MLVIEVLCLEMVGPLLLEVPQDIFVQDLRMWRRVSFEVLRIRFVTTASVGMSVDFSMSAFICDIFSASLRSLRLTIASALFLFAMDCRASFATSCIDPVILSSVGHWGPGFVTESVMVSVVRTESELLRTGV